MHAHRAKPEAPRARIGREDSSLSDAYVLSARIAEASGQRPQAFEATDRARRAARRLLERYLPTLDEAAQLAYMKDVDQPRMHTALAQGLKHSEVQGISHLLPRLDDQRQGRHPRRAGPAAPAHPRPRDAESRLLSQELREVYNAQANLTYGWVPGGESGQTSSSIAWPSARELVRRIGQSSRQGSQERQGTWVELARSQGPSRGFGPDRVDPPGAVPHGEDANRPHDRPASYAAVIVPGGADSSVRIIDLGPADVIDAAVTAAQGDPTRPRAEGVSRAGEREAERRVRVPLRKLAGLILDPLYPHVARAQRWYLSPTPRSGWCPGSLCRSTTRPTSSNGTRSITSSAAATWSGPVSRSPRGRRW